MLYRSLNDLVDPGPSGTLLFGEQREEAMYGSSYWIDMTGYPDQPASWQFNSTFPSGRHNGVGCLSFAGGNAEIKRWTDSRTAPVRWKDGVTPSPYNKDILWLQERVTRKLK